MTTQLARAATWYAKHGWTIFPLRPKTKEPFGGQGVYCASSDSDTVSGWWKRYPLANIGLHCGGSNFLALDLDEYKDTFGGDGFLGRDDEETVTNLTGGGGTHLLYALPEGTRYGNAKGNLPPGIDIRGWGGYIVLPPSVHPSGKPYQWESGYGPHEIEALPLPDRLRQILDEAKGHQHIIGPADSYAVKVAQGLVESVLERLGIKHFGVRSYDTDGRKWVLRSCPFAPRENPHPSDRSAYIVIARDGHIGAGCHHARCQDVLRQAKLGGWRYLLREREAYVTA